MGTLRWLKRSQTQSLDISGDGGGDETKKESRRKPPGKHFFQGLCVGVAGKGIANVFKEETKEKEEVRAH